MFSFNTLKTTILLGALTGFPLVVAFAHRYDKKAGIGTVVATMMPYSVTFFILWTLLLIVWYLLGLPLGPGAGIYYQRTATPQSGKHEKPR